MLTMNKMKLLGACCAVSGLLAPTVAVAASPASYSPLVALSMVASPQSQAALCAVGAAGAASAAAATTQASPQGCVLPVADAPVATGPSQVLPVGPARFSPLLIGIGAIGLGVLLYALLHNDDNEEPLSPV